MKVNLKMSPRLIPNIASIYNDTNRVLMEFVDNSIDSAEEFIPIGEREKYPDFPHPVVINVYVKGRSYKDGEVIIRDNCKGISDLGKLLQNVGNSDKKTQIWTNGQFGYGIFSFMACCDELQITTKYGTSTKTVRINKEHFNQDIIDDVSFDINETEKEFDFSSGTEVILRYFSKEKWDLIKVTDFKEEIENHFEFILNRKNINISIHDKNGNKYVCKEFNYVLIPGKEYNKDIRLVYYKKMPDGRKVKIETPHPIKLKLKITNGRNLSRSPVFISKQRRIAEIRDIKTFRSLNKSSIWSHPHITGYINVGSILNPTIARNDYKNDSATRRLFAAIIDAEPEILEYFKDIYNRDVLYDYSSIELKFTSAFNNHINKLFNSDINALEIYSEVKLVNDSESEQYIVLVDSKINGKADVKGSNTTGNKKWNSELTKNTKIVLSGIENSKNRLSIKIDDKSEPTIGRNNKANRSELIESNVIIFKKHTDFKKRIDYSRIGEERISHSLLSYICSEMILRYFEISNKSNSDTNNNQQLLYFTELLYKMEFELRALIGTPLGKIS